jgi:basic membrane protein A
VGLGSAAYCQESGSCKIVGVDTDWTVSASEYSDVIFTSVLKNIDNAVFDAAKSVADGSFAGGVYLGTLENDGVGIAEVNGAASELTAELDQLKADIIAGTITLPE